MKQGYFGKRISTIFIPYFLLETLLLPLRLRLIPETEKLFLSTWLGFGIKDYLLDIALIRPLYTNGWFLTYIALWYLIFYFVMRLRDKLADKFYDSTGQTVKWVTVGIACVCIFIFGREIWAEQAMSFALGMLISDIKDIRVFKRIQNWKILLVFFVIATLFLALKQTAYIREAPQIVMKAVQLMIKLPYGYIVVMMPLLMSRNKMLHGLAGKANKLLYSIGAISFEFYLIHGYVLNSCGDGMMDAVVWIVLTIAVSLLFHFAVKHLRKRLYSGGNIDG